MTELLPPEIDPMTDVVDFHALGATTDLTNCDREPIHLSGAIQPHGVLLGVDEADLTVQWASANTHAHLGVEASGLLGGGLDLAVGDDAAQRLRIELADPHLFGPYPISCRPPGGGNYVMTWHRVDGLVLLELEPAEATTAASESARSISALRSLVALQSSEDVMSLCRAAAVEVSRLTGYDRVMVYRFHPDHHGEVVAEQHAPGMEPYLGLHYPASDIPRQARKLYLLNHLRVIADVDYEPVPLLSTTDGAVDISLAGLRSVSRMHVQYLRNMGVQATLVMSLMRGTQLWGMIACHHRTPKRIDAALRTDCALLAQALSQHLVHLDDDERGAYQRRLSEIQRQLLSRISGAQSSAAALVSGLPSPLELTAADGMVARIDGRTVTAGSVPPEEAVADLLIWLRAQELPSELVCTELPRRFPAFAPFTQEAAGVLAMPLAPAYQNYVLWFREEQIQAINWAGNPDAAMVGNPYSRPGDQETVKLGPRESFAAFRQEVRGQCRPWLPAEIQAARELADAIPRLQLTSARNRLASRALRDPITCLPNQALILAHADTALEERGPGTGTVAMLRINLDHFTRLNESLGRLNGDQILRHAGDRLITVLSDAPQRAHLAHAGGGDFIVVCKDVTAEEAMQFAGRIVEDFRAPFKVAERQVVATTSIGVAIADLDMTTTAADLMREASTAMSRMKEWGRNGAAMYCP